MEKVNVTFGEAAGEGEAGKKIVKWKEGEKRDLVVQLKVDVWFDLPAGVDPYHVSSAFLSALREMEITIKGGKKLPINSFYTTDAIVKEPREKSK